MSLTSFNNKSLKSVTLFTTISAHPQVYESLSYVTNLNEI